MDIALVNNADKGVGPSICKRLIEMGFRVYGLASSFKNTFFVHADFKAVECDVSDPKEMARVVEEIIEKEKSISVFIHAGYPKPKRSLETTAYKSVVEQIEDLLLVPFFLTRALIPSLKQFRGHIIFLSWEALYGPIGHAASEASKVFLEQVFEELQDFGVSATQISLKCHPKELELEEAPQKISVRQLTDAIERVLRFPRDNTITQLSIRPQGHTTANQPSNAVPFDEFKGVLLPEKKYFPVEPEPIFTPKPEPVVLEEKPKSAKKKRPKKKVIQQEEVKEPEEKVEKAPETPKVEAKKPSKFKKKKQASRAVIEKLPEEPKKEVLPQKEAPRKDNDQKITSYKPMAKKKSTRRRRPQAKPENKE